MQTNLLYFLYITSEEKEFYKALFLAYRPRTKCSSSQFSRQIAFIQYPGPSRHAWTFSEKAQKFPKSPLGQPVLTFDKRQICKEILKEL